MKPSYCCPGAVFALLCVVALAAFVYCYQAPPPPSSAPSPAVLHAIQGVGSTFGPQLANHEQRIGDLESKEASR